MKAQTTLNLQRIIMAMVIFFALCCFETSAQPKIRNDERAVTYNPRLEIIVNATIQQIRYVAPRVIEEDGNLNIVTEIEAEKAMRNLENLALKTEKNVKYTAPHDQPSVQHNVEIGYLPEIQSKPVKVEFCSSRDLWLIEAGYAKRAKYATTNGKIFRRGASSKEVADTK